MSNEQSKKIADILSEKGDDEANYKVSMTVLRLLIIVSVACVFTWRVCEKQYSLSSFV